VPPPLGGPISQAPWQLTGYLDADGNLAAVPPEVFAHAFFHLESEGAPTTMSGPVEGSTGCAPFEAQVAVDGTELFIRGLTVSMATCESPAAEVHTALLEQLADAAAFTATTEELTLYGFDGQPLLTFVAVPEEAGPTPTPAGRQARITEIRARNGRYVVDYEVFGYRQELPGRHVHFFFDTVPQREAGVPGGGPWILYGGPSPFTGYAVADRPASATQMCILVANPDHSVIRGTGNCVDLPR
jgi:hypothetical protein